MREREIEFLLTSQMPTMCSGQRLGARNSSQDCHAGGKDSTACAISCCLPGHTLTGIRSQAWSQDRESGTMIWKAGVLATEPNVLSCTFSHRFIPFLSCPSLSLSFEEQRSNTQVLLPLWTLKVKRDHNSLPNTQNKPSNLHNYSF